jgi:hypothetical protein
VGARRVSEIYSDFTILLARQRSGTNPLRSILRTHDDIFCFNEIFNFGDRDALEALLRKSNFFNFVRRYADADVQAIFPDQHEAIFVDFLEYLRCFSDRRHLVLDVKYNMIQFLTEPWARDITSPYLFDLVEKYELRVLNLTRRNYLRYVLSAIKAWDSGRYTISSIDRGYRDEKKRIDAEWILAEIAKCAREDELIRQRFATYRHFRSFDYVDVFPPGRRAISASFLAEVADWLGIRNTFVPASEYQRQAKLPLEETLENYDEVVEVLQGTPYAYCLEDEPAFRSQQRRRQRRQ